MKKLLGVFGILFFSIVIYAIVAYAWSNMHVKGEFNNWTDQQMIQDVDGAGSDWFWPFKATASDDKSYFIFGDYGDYDNKKIAEDQDPGDHTGVTNGSTNIELGGITAGETYIITFHNDGNEYDMSHITSFGIVGDPVGDWNNSTPMTKSGDIYKYTFSATDTKNYYFRLWPNDIQNNWGAQWVFGSNSTTNDLEVPLNTETNCGIGSELKALYFYASETGNYTIAVRPYDHIVYVNKGNDSSLPVELSTFTASLSNGQVVLSWETQSEVNNLGFNVLRSESAEAGFAKLNNTLIPGAGNSSEAHRYSFTDVNVNAGKTYYYKLEDVDFNGTRTEHRPISIFVGSQEGQIPEKFALLQNYPNPFNPTTTITFELKKAGQVTLSIYDTNGQLVRRLIHENREAGIYKISWDGKNNAGLNAGTGLYFCRLITDKCSLTRKMLLVR